MPRIPVLALPVSLCLLITFGYTSGGRFLGTSAQSGQKADVTQSTEAWSVSHASITNGDGQQVMGNGNSIQTGDGTQAIGNVNKVVKHIEGKKCEGSGNAFDDGAAQVVCCFGDEIQCCGTAVAAVNALKSNNPSTKDGVTCSSVPSQSTVRNIQQKWGMEGSSTKTGDGGTTITGDNNKVHIDNPDKPTAATLAFQRIAKCLVSSDLVCVENGINTLMPLVGSNGVGKASQFGNMPPGVKEAGTNATLLALCWNTGQYFQCSLLCNNQLVPPDGSETCEQAEKRLQHGIDEDTPEKSHHRDRDRSDADVNWLVVAQEAKDSLFHTKKVNGVKYTAKEALVKEVETHPDTPQAAQALFLLASFWPTGGLPHVYGDVTISGEKLDPKAMLEKALSIDPNYGDAWALLGDQGGGSIVGRHYDKKQCYQRAVELDPSNPDIWFSIFHGLKDGDKIELDHKKYNKKHVLEQCLSLDPHRHQSFWTELALLGGGTVNKEEYGVKACIINGLKVNIRSPTLWYMLAKHGGGDVRDHHYSVRECLEQALIYTQDKRTTREQKVFPREIPKMWRWLGNLGGATIRGEHYDKDECFDICYQEGMSVEQCRQQDDQVKY